VKINLLEGHSRKNMARVKQVTPVILYLRTNSLEGALNKGDLSMEMTYLKEPDPFVRRWLEVIEDGSIEAIPEFLDSID
jgi:hypothetical protein